MWLDIRKGIRKLQREGKKQIGLHEFYQLAEKVEDPTYVLTWLTQSGVFFYKEGLFNDEIILDQAWAIEAIYTLFDREKFYYRALVAQKGEFSGKDLMDIWADKAKPENERFSEAEQELFVSFMLSCELCFETTEKDKERYHTAFQERTFVAPQLLPEKGDETEKLLELVWKNESPVFIRFEHEFLHYGVIQSFIVRTQKLAKREAIWKTGILLEAEGEKIQVEEIDGKVEVIAGRNSRKLLAKIRKELSELQGMEAREYLSLNGKDFVLKDELEKQAQLGSSKVPTSSGKDISIDPLMIFLSQGEQFPIGREKNEILPIEYEEELKIEETKEEEPKLPPKTKPRVYFSYAWGASEPDGGKSLVKHVDALFDSLSTELKEYQFLRDKMSILYGGLINDYMRELSEWRPDYCIYFRTIY